MPVPPKSVQANAERGLELGRRYRVTRPVGAARARDLAHGRDVSTSTLKRMRSFLKRNGDAQARARAGWGDPSSPSREYVAHLRWGGDRGLAWAERELRRLGEL